MHATLALFLLSFVAAPGAHQAKISNQSREGLVHFVVINMSGKTREIQHHGDVVSLPVAERVALQIPAEDSIEITSETNAKVEDAITIHPGDEGRTILIH